MTLSPHPWPRRRAPSRAPSEVADMPVVPVNIAALLWPFGYIPYEENDHARQLEGHIAQFNREVGFGLFLPRRGESNYAELKIDTQGESPIGCQGGRQVIRVRNDHTQHHSALHEMAHCAGLG